MRDIAKYYKCHFSTIRKWMIKNKIQRRGFSGTSTKYNNRMYKNRHFLRQQYLILKLSISEIAQKEKTSETSIRRWLRKYNIPTRQNINQYIMRKIKLGENI